jgi:uncharacterized protein YciI
MSTISEVKKHKFLVYALDKTEEGTLAKRYEVRTQHLEELQPRLDSGTVRKCPILIFHARSVFNNISWIELGGMLLSPEAIELESHARKAVGSLLIVQARTINEARTVIESDVYYTSGVVSGSYQLSL